MWQHVNCKHTNAADIPSINNAEVKVFGQYTWDIICTLIVDIKAKSLAGVIYIIMDT